MSTVCVISVLVTVICLFFINLMNDLLKLDDNEKNQNNSHRLKSKCIEVCSIIVMNKEIHIHIRLVLLTECLYIKNFVCKESLHIRIFNENFDNVYPHTIKKFNYIFLNILQTNEIKRQNCSSHYTLSSVGVDNDNKLYLRTKDY